LLDSSWVSHLDLLQQLREGINIRGYGQEDPYRLHAQEAFDAFVQYMADFDAKLSKQLRFFIQHYNS
jgi:preprotein translocase subunit SecA